MPVGWWRAEGLRESRSGTFSTSPIGTQIAFNRAESVGTPTGEGLAAGSGPSLSTWTAGPEDPMRTKKAVLPVVVAQPLIAIRHAGVISAPLSQA
jgi:hypothetical protein